jgi:hypothetical protein
MKIPSFAQFVERSQLCFRSQQFAPVFKPNRGVTGFVVSLFFQHKQDSIEHFMA